MTIFDRLPTINKCFSAETIEDIIKAFVRILSITCLKSVEFLRL